MKCACPFCGETLQGAPFKSEKQPGWKFSCKGNANYPHGRVYLYLQMKAGESAPGPVATGALSAAKSLLERAKRLSGKGEV